MEKKSIISKITEAGLKKTKYRVNIIDLLEKSNTLLSAQDIHTQLIKNKTKVNLSTVYRTLDKLTENGIINKVDIEQEKQSLYEYNRDEHHHFLICKNCNKIETIYNCPLHDYEQEIMKDSGFYITGHKIEFYGYCKECQKSLNISSL
ncbi:transcriptional repressor [Mycoplasmatota bacterium]|nr:transcriptional repressor [Mycoplasmatota bacterium]